MLYLVGPDGITVECTMDTTLEKALDKPRPSIAEFQ
jgi:hypothetical protein